MRKESDTSKARKFILENKNKMTYREMVEEIKKFTKLKEVSIKNIVTEVIRGVYSNCDIPTGLHGQRARVIIETNLYTKTKEELVEYISENTILSRYTAEKIYEVILNEKKIKPEEKTKEKLLYKGRQRRFFYFDTSKLWRTI